MGIAVLVCRGCGRRLIGFFREKKGGEGQEGQYYGVVGPKP